MTEDGAGERALVDTVRGLVEVWRNAGLTTPRDRIRLELEESFRQQGSDELMTYVTVQSLDTVVRPLPERVETAQRYWRWARPNQLDTWDESVIPSVLEQFDQLYVPSNFRWAHSEDDDDDLHAAIAEITSTGASGYTIAALFAEAVGSATGNRYPSVSERVNEELLWAVPHHPQVRLIVESRSPVGLLCNIGIDFNILSALQSAYYTCRQAPLGSESRDALDLTVLLSAGFILNRWSWEGIRPETVTRALVGQEPLADL